MWWRALFAPLRFARWVIEGVAIWFLTHLLEWEEGRQETMNEPPAVFRFEGYAAFTRTVAAIRAAHAGGPAYDHRPRQPARERELDGGVYGSEEFRRAYVGFKWAVAKVLQPRAVVEIGVGSGTAAFAFLDAAPRARYVGIDDGSKDRVEHFPYLEHVKREAQRAGRSVELWVRDVRELRRLPRADLLHVDAAHNHDSVLADVRLALSSGSTWILVDDCRYPEVAAAALCALRDALAAGQPWRHWAYFEDTWTGSVLIRNSL